MVVVAGQQCEPSLDERRQEDPASVASCQATAAAQTNKTLILLRLYFVPGWFKYIFTVLVTIFLMWMLLNIFCYRWSRFLGALSLGDEQRFCRAELARPDTNASPWCCCFIPLAFLILDASIWDPVRHENSASCGKQLIGAILFFPCQCHACSISWSQAVSHPCNQSKCLDPYQHRLVAGQCFREHFYYITTCTRCLLAFVQRCDFLIVLRTQLGYSLSKEAC